MLTFSCSCGPKRGALCEEDLDMDGVVTGVEGEEDVDGDGIPNHRDPDSDGDGAVDAIEHNIPFGAGCDGVLRDTNDDNIPDIFDTDSNGDTVPDGQQLGDIDNDGITDAYDLDLDNDGLKNAEELSADGRIVDTDNDGLADHLDVDSDNDNIADGEEGLSDADGDGVPNFRDADSDGDGFPDADEAGDDDLNTPPVNCGVEIQFILGLSTPDELPDYLDLDSDGDGVPDNSEFELGTGRCDLDSDDDGASDLLEAGYAVDVCRDNTVPACTCATEASCVPPENYVAIEQSGTEGVFRLPTNHGSANVFFLLDATSSMGPVLAKVARVIAAEGGLADSLRAAIPSILFGAALHGDFPISPYGYPEDEVFSLLSRMRVIRDDPASRDAFSALFPQMSIYRGNDRAEAQLPALWYTATGSDARFSSGETRVTLDEARCDSGVGAPCFQEGALPVVVHITGSFAHGGPDSTGHIEASYEDITSDTPEALSFDGTVGALSNLGARYVGVNASDTRCDVAVDSDETPCFFQRAISNALGQGGEVYELPEDPSDSAFVSSMTAAILEVLEAFPIDVRARAIGAGAEFVVSIAPACEGQNDECWAGVRPGSWNDSGFNQVVPGTDLDFRVSFRWTRPSLRPHVRAERLRLRTAAGVTTLTETNIVAVLPAAP